MLLAKTPHALRRALTAAVERLRIPYEDDLGRHPNVEEHHARSVAFLAEQGLVPDEGTRWYLDRARVAEGMAIALPDVAPPLFQLAVDWTNHNCLHDDAMESTEHGVELVAALSRRYAQALGGRIDGRGHHPLVAAMVAWRHRALALRVDAALLERFVQRAERMAEQFVLERQDPTLDEEEYLQWRVQAGPSDAWFGLIDLVLGPARRPDSMLATELQQLAIGMNVTGNELRTATREIDREIPTNAILRAEDPYAAIERMVRRHDDRARRFERLVRLATDSRHRDYARCLARAVHATHQYELRSVRGCAWPAPAEPLVASALG